MKNKAMKFLLISLFVGGNLLVKNMNKDITVFAYKPLSGINIVIDAGHGGRDAGAESNGIKEQEINLSIAKFFKEHLLYAGASVKMTRDGNYDLSQDNTLNHKKSDMKKRAEIINSPEVDLFISIHLNSFPDVSVKGAQIFYQKQFNESKVFAQLMQKRFKDLTNSKMSIKTGDYFILNETENIGVLAECGFLSNYSDRENLQNVNYQKEIAKTLYQSVLDYFEGFI